MKKFSIIVLSMFLVALFAMSCNSNENTNNNAINSTENAANNEVNEEQVDTNTETDENVVAYYCT